MNNQNQRENEDWLVLSDLSMGGFIIFLIIAVAFIARHNNLYEQQGIFEAIKKFESDKVEVDSIDRKGTLRFITTQKSELFASNSADLSPYFKKALDDFLPAYLDTIQQYKDKIIEIRIEGHTDNDCRDRTHCYETNLDLSVQRANNVVKYILNSNALKSRADSSAQVLQRLFVASGHSYSQALDAKGQLISTLSEIEKRIDKDRSRRVDFRIILRAEQ